MSDTGRGGGRSACHGNALAFAVGAIALKTNVEHIDPTVAARLEEEGVADPDRVLSDLVEDFAGTTDARGVPEVVTSGHPDRTAAPEQDQARSSVEQRTAITPTSGGAPVGRSDSVIEALEWWIVGGMAVLSIVLAAVIGGEMRALPAIFLPLGAGWIALQYGMARGRDSSDRAARDDGSARRRLVPISVFVVAGVVWFMLVVGWIGGLL